MEYAQYAFARLGIQQISGLPKTENVHPADSIYRTAELDSEFAE